MWNLPDHLEAILTNRRHVDKIKWNASWSTKITVFYPLCPMFINLVYA